MLSGRDKNKIKPKAKIFKRYFNFSYLLAKRLKAKISSRKFKYMSLEKENDNVSQNMLDSERDSNFDDVTTSPLKKVNSTILSEPEKLKKKALSMCSPKITGKRGRRSKRKILDNNNSLEKIKEESNEETIKEEVPQQSQKQRFDLGDSSLYDQDDGIDEPQEIINLRNMNPELKKEDSFIASQIGARKDSNIDINMDEANPMEDEVQRMFMDKKVSDNDFFRRQSSISDFRFLRKDSFVSRNSDVNNQLDNQIDNRFDNQLDNQVENQPDNRLDNQLDNQFTSKIHNQVPIQLENQNIDMDDILNEDDQDSEDFPIEDIKIENTRSLSMKVIPSLGRNLLDNKPNREIDTKEEFTFKNDKKSVSHLDKHSSSNSSMKVDSESSSSNKEESNDDAQEHDSDHSDESDLLKEEVKLTPQKKNRSGLRKANTEILPPIRNQPASQSIKESIIKDQGKVDTSMPFKNIDLKDLDDIQIPMKKSISGMHINSKKNDELDKLVKEHKDIDEIRDKKNKKDIMKHFNMIKVKTYSQQDPLLNGQANKPDSKVKCVLHLTESELKIIRKNRNLLLDLGAMLFWDHKYDNIRGDHAYFHHNESINEKKVEFQISGSYTEVERTKEASIYLLNYERKIEKEQIVVIEIDMWVPKILIRKVIGYQEKHVIEYYKKFDVTISYDSNLINDESYPIQEDTMITIKGKKAFAEIVSNDINERVSSLIVKTLHLAPADCKYLKEKICQLKCRIDPAELRI